MPVTKFVSLRKLLPLIIVGIISLACLNNTNVPADNATTVQQPRGIWATEWSPDGKYIALGGDDSTLWLYNANDYSVYRTYRLNSVLRGLSWHPKDNLLAIASMKGIQMLDVNEGKLTTIPGLKTGGRGIDWNHTGELLALADGGGIVQVMDRQGNIIRSIKKHNIHSYLSLHWHPSKNILLTSSDEIILFDTTGRQLNMFRHRKELTGLLSVRWHPSGTFFASGDYGHENEGMPTLLQFWKEDGTLLKTMSGHHAEIRNLRWSKDGSLLATASDALRIWQQDGKLLHTGNSGVKLWGVAWSKDGKFIVTGAYADGTVTLWDDHAKLLKKLTAK